ncbi:MAG TPA: PEGA domain-containing protein [Candidatus Sulfotelmatobacter sp.]|nr:PEGA domain-containing protein [Candidatus Sulfotelmatobacter sp.]
MRRLHRIAVLAVLVGAGAWSLHAQAVAEAAAATSNSSMAAQTMKVPPPKLASPAKDNKSAYMIARSGPSEEEINRKDLEDNAGPNAGKLLLRSVPTGADIFINGRLVGKTPLLMVVAPGKYKIAMRGSRQDEGQKLIGLMPKETQTVVITLKERYPSSIVIR